MCPLLNWAQKSHDVRWVVRTGKFFSHVLRLYNSHSGITIFICKRPIDSCIMHLLFGEFLLFCPFPTLCVSVGGGCGHWLLLFLLSKLRKIHAKNVFVLSYVLRYLTLQQNNKILSEFWISHAPFIYF